MRIVCFDAIFWSEQSFVRTIALLLNYLQIISLWLRAELGRQACSCLFPWELSQARGSQSLLWRRWNWEEGNLSGCGKLIYLRSAILLLQGWLWVFGRDKTPFNYFGKLVIIMNALWEGTKTKATWQLCLTKCACVLSAHLTSRKHYDLEREESESIHLKFPAPNVQTFEPNSKPPKLEPEDPKP